MQGASALGGGSTPGRIPDSVIDRWRRFPAFVRTRVRADPLAQFVDADGETIGGGGPPTFGVSWVDDGPFRLTDGQAPDGPGQVAMDAGTAQKHGYQSATASGSS